MKTNAIQGQRISNLSTGLKQAESYLGGVSRILAEEKPNIEMARNEIQEIQDFLLWLSQQ